MNYKDLEREYDKNPVAFEKRTAEIKTQTEELKRIMNNFAKEVDEFNRS